MNVPTTAQLEHGCTAFHAHERRDAMYKTATFLVDHFWGQPAEMADSLGVLLLTWNQAFYRYGPFDFGKLEKCIAKNLPALKGYRARSILDYTAQDDAPIEALFAEFLAALAIAEGSKSGAQSPVAVAKTLHLIAPGFFPLWDKEIAKAYGCDYTRRPAGQYLAFLGLAQAMARALQTVSPPPGRTLLKLLDEFNYAKFTKQWV